MSPGRGMKSQSAQSLQEYEGLVVGRTDIREQRWDRIFHYSSPINTVEW